MTMRRAAIGTLVESRKGGTQDVDTARTALRQLSRRDLAPQPDGKPQSKPGDISLEKPGDRPG